MRQIVRSLALMAVTATLAPGLPITTAIAADAPVTLRLAFAEAPDHLSQTFLDTFQAEVAARSRSSIAIEIIYKAGGDADSGEIAVAEHVLSGDMELAVVPVRAWRDAGVSAFDALAAPFLITTDELAVAVARDPLVQPLLDSIADQGLVGLAVWPEDLRHPFTYTQNGPPLLTPADFQGQTIWALPSTLQTEILESLGASVVHSLNPDQGVADGTIRGAESSLFAARTNLGGSPTGTGDVTFYPKWHTLVAEDAAWSRLSADQQTIIRDAAATAREAYLAQRPTEAEAAAAYCAVGGSVVLAGPDALEAFRGATSAVTDRIGRDPLAASAIDAIRSLERTVPVASGITPCRPSGGPEPTVPPIPPGPATTVPPSGIYTLTLTEEALYAQMPDRVWAQNNAGRWTLRIDGDTGSWDNLSPNGFEGHCPIKFTVPDGDRVRLTGLADCGPTWFEFRWHLDGDQLTTQVVNVDTGTAVEIGYHQALMGGPWTKDD